MFHVLTKKYLESLSPEHARLEWYFRALQGVAITSIGYMLAVLWIPGAKIPSSYLSLELGMHALCGPFLCLALFLRVHPRPWVHRALSGLLMGAAGLGALWVYIVVGLSRDVVTDGRVIGVYSHPMFAAVLALNLVRAFLAVRLLVVLRKPAGAAYFGVRDPAANPGSPAGWLAGFDIHTSPAKRGDPESREATLVRRCLGTFVGLSLPWVVPCCYYTSLEFTEPIRVNNYQMEPTSKSVAIAIIIYLLLGPLPFFIAMLGVKRKVWVHRLLSTMLWSVAFLSVGYAVLELRVLLTNQISGNGGVDRELNRLVVTAAVALDAVRLISIFALLIVLRRSDVRALYGHTTPPKRF